VVLDGLEHADDPPELQAVLGVLGGRVDALLGAAGALGGHEDAGHGGGGGRRAGQDGRLGTIEGHGARAAGGVELAGDRAGHAGGVGGHDDHVVTGDEHEQVGQVGAEHDTGVPRNR
jgi:hypothetical protein